MRSSSREVACPGSRFSVKRTGLGSLLFARNEMEERIRKRLGAVARGVTVRTFHSLGMAIIGDAEGKRPALARSAENDRALFDLLKGIVADLLANGSRRKPCWTGSRTSSRPTGASKISPSWGAYWNYIRPERHPVSEGRHGEELRGMRDRELPLSERHRL